MLDARAGREWREKSWQCVLSSTGSRHSAGRCWKRSSIAETVSLPSTSRRRNPAPRPIRSRKRRSRPSCRCTSPSLYCKPEVWDAFRALKPDLQVMAFVTLFVPEDFLHIPTHGSIQDHPSLLPAYRGPSAINWPIIKGETETGLSIFWPDNGLDTGDVRSKKRPRFRRPTPSAQSISTGCFRWKV